MSEPLYCRYCSAAGNVKLFYCSTCKAAECEDCRGSSGCKGCSARRWSQLLIFEETKKQRESDRIQLIISSIASGMVPFAIITAMITFSLYFPLDPYLESCGLLIIGMLLINGLWMIGSGLIGQASSRTNFVIGTVFFLISSSIALNRDFVFDHILNPYVNEETIVGLVLILLEMTGLWWFFWSFFLIFSLLMMMTNFGDMVWGID